MDLSPRIKMKLIDNRSPMEMLLEGDSEAFTKTMKERDEGPQFITCLLQHIGADPLNPRFNKEINYMYY
jgi:hypothetical protein